MVSLQDPGHGLDGAMRSWRLSQPSYGELAEQREKLSRWAMAEGNGAALLELGRLTPPKLETEGDSSGDSGENSPSYSTLREVVEAPSDSSPPPLATPEKTGARGKETGPKLSGKWWDRPRDGAKFGTAVGPEAVVSGKVRAWVDLDSTDTASEAGAESAKVGGESENFSGS